MCVQQLHIEKGRKGGRDKLRQRERGKYNEAILMSFQDQMDLLLNSISPLRINTKLSIKKKGKDHNQTHSILSKLF